MAYRLRSSITRPLTPNIGIDPDFRVYVSDRLLEIHDGPFLELGLKGIVGQVIRLPDEARIGPIGIGWRYGSNNSGKPPGFRPRREYWQEAVPG